MGTITTIVNDAVEEKFRKAVKEHVGEGKGTIGRAITQALEKWVRDVEQEEIRERALARLERGYSMGKILYKKRAELYERK